MHSMVGAFAPYKRKRQQVQLVDGCCYHFNQCTVPCGIVMLIISLLFIILGSSLLIYIFHFNGCNTSNTTDTDNSEIDIISISSSSFKCNRQAMKVLGITFVVSGSVLFIISLLIIKYSRSDEERNVIRATKSSLTTNNIKHQHQNSQSTSSEQEQNHMIVSLR